MAQTQAMTDALPDLTAFQRDLLFVIAAVGPAKGLRIKDDLQGYYTGEINHGRLYPNLDALADRGLITKGQRDRRTNEYELTPRGRNALSQRRQWEADHIGE